SGNKIGTSKGRHQQRSCLEIPACENMRSLNQFWPALFIILAT
ncbi:34111_t:CDS:2, partial [Racocetra persica]